MRRGHLVSMAVGTGIAWYFLSEALSFALKLEERHLNLVQGSMAQFLQQVADNAYFNWLGWLIFWVAAIISYREVGKVRLDAVFAINVGILVAALSYPLRAASGGPLGMAMVNELIRFVLGSLFGYVCAFCLIGPVTRMAKSIRIAREKFGNNDGNRVLMVQAVVIFLENGEEDGTDFCCQKYEQLEAAFRFNRAAAQRKYFWETVRTVPMLVGLQIDCQLLRWRWARRFATRR